MNNKQLDDVLKSMPDFFTSHNFRVALINAAPELSKFKFGNYLKGHKNLRHVTKFTYIKKRQLKAEEQKTINFIDDNPLPVAPVVPTVESFLNNIPINIIIQYLQSKKYIVLQS